MLLLLVAPLFSIHAAFFAGHVHLHTHVILIIVLLVLSSVCAIRSFTANSACSIFASSPSCAAHHTRCVTVLLPLRLCPCGGDTIDRWRP